VLVQLVLLVLLANKEQLGIKEQLVKLGLRA